MSVEPPVKRVFQHDSLIEFPYGIYMGNVINIREIVMDYSHLSHENYPFLVQCASDAYLKRRLHTLSKIDMMTLYQKHVESNIYYNFSNLLAFYATFRALYGEMFFENVWKAPLPSRFTPIKNIDCEIAFCTSSSDTSGLFTANIRFRKGIDLNNHMDAESQAFFYRYGIVVDNVKKICLTRNTLWIWGKDSQIFVV